MHPKNKHKTPYNLDSLSKEVPELKDYLLVTKNNNTSINFANPKAVKALNKALLIKHYNIKYWDFPDENLCPPIPGRVDYIYHLTDLIGAKKNVKILDIGTGATIIYALLGVAINDWEFVVSDIDKKALKNAKKIITENALNHKIKIRLQKNPLTILKGVIEPNEQFAATMCNPPFYKSAEEAKQATEKKIKRLKIHTKQRNFSGTANELWYKGGEKAFLHNYLYESSLYKENSTWFTALVSKKENLKSIKISLKKLGAESIKIIPMQQGNKISRIIAWSFVL